MSAIDSSRSLLGHDDGLPVQLRKEDDASRGFNRRPLIWAVSLLLTLLIIFFVLDRRWYAVLDATGPDLPEHLDVAQQPGNERDLKWLLHPEDHVSRDPCVRHLSWNITKAMISPNGVKKEVFLINGISNLHLIP